MKTTHAQPGVCRTVVALLIAAAATACSGRQEATPRPQPRRRRPQRRRAATDAPIPATASPYDDLPEAVRLSMDKPFTGDLDALVARRSIRVGVTFNRTHYFIDQGPATRDHLRGIEAVRERSERGPEDRQPQGARGDRAAAEGPAVPGPHGRQDRHGRRHGDRHPRAGEAGAFSEPTRTNVNEVVVTGPGAPPITTVDDLAGQEVFVRKGSIYEESLSS